MPFIQAREAVAADLNGGSPVIPLVITMASVLGGERLGPGMGSDLCGFPQRAGAKPGAVLRQPAWQQATFSPGEVLVPLQGGFETVLLGLCSGFCCRWPIWQLLGGFGP